MMIRPSAFVLLRSVPVFAWSCFVRVQFRRVGGQRLQVQPGRRARGEEECNPRAAMDARPVPQHQQPARDQPQQLAQEGHHIAPAQRPFLLMHGQRPSGVMAQITARWSRVHGARSTDVCPRHAYIRTAAGNRLKPAASTATSVRPSARALHQPPAGAAPPMRRPPPPCAGSPGGRVPAGSSRWPAAAG